MSREALWGLITFMLTYGIVITLVLNKTLLKLIGAAHG